MAHLYETQWSRKKTFVAFLLHVHFSDPSQPFPTCPSHTFLPSFQPSHALLSVYFLCSAQQCSLWFMHAVLCQLKSTISPPPRSNVQRVCRRAPSWYIHLICVQSEQSLKPIKTGDEGCLFCIQLPVCVCRCVCTYKIFVQLFMWRGFGKVTVLVMEQVMWRPKVWHFYADTFNVDFIQKSFKVQCASANNSSVLPFCYTISI